MGTRNDDISLKLAKAVKSGFLPDVADNEVAILEAEAKKLFRTDKERLSYDPLATDATRLGKWRSGLANRKARIMVVADSWGDGTGTSGGSAWNSVWTRRLQERLRATYFNEMGVQRAYVPAGPFSTSTTAPVTYVKSNGASAVDYMGLSRRCYIISTSAENLTINFSGTGADLHYGTNGTAQSFNYTVDGGAPQLVTITATGQTIETPTYRTQLRGLADTAHSVVITPVGSSFMYYGGTIPFKNDENNGIHLYENTKTNMGTAYWTTDPHRFMPVFGVVQPDLVIIALGINDFQESVQKITSDAFKANYKTLIANVRSYSGTNPSIVLAIPPESGGSGLSPFSEFPEKIYEIAQEDGNVAVFDSRSVLGDTIATTNVWNYRADTYHINNAGHQAYGDAMFQLLNKI